MSEFRCVKNYLMSNVMMNDFFQNCLQNLSTVYEYMYTHMGSTGFSDLRALKPWQVLVKVRSKKLPTDGLYHDKEL
jgi:hypothetical protein